MAWDLATAKQYLGITDGSQDANITRMMDVTMSAVEKFLQRGLELAQETVTYRDRDFRRVVLPRFPVTQVLKVDGVDGLPSDWHLMPRVGWILLPTRRYFQELEIEYEGGYDPLPADLEQVLWEIFMRAWASIDENTGGPDPTGPGVVQGSGDVKSLTVFDGFKMEFDVGASVLSDAESALTEQQATWGWLAPWASTLELYRSERGAGVGIA